MLAEWGSRRLTVNDTDKGAELREQVAELQRLMSAYRCGIIKSKS